MSVTTTARAAREAARAAYLARAPEPDPLDGACSTCKARTGKACHRQGKEVPTHQARTTRANRDAGRRRKEADLAGRAAAFVHAGLTMGATTEQLAGWVAKQHPSAAAAYLASQGWTPSERGDRSAWRSPDQTTHSPDAALRAAIEAARP